MKFTTPETSAAEHESLVADAESILQALGLPYQTMLLCGGDKRTQTADIRRAIALAAQWQEQNHGKG